MNKGLPEIRCPGTIGYRSCGRLLLKGEILDGCASVLCERCRHVVYIGAGITFIEIKKQNIDIDKQYIVEL